MDDENAPRKIMRIGNFDITPHETNDKWKQLDGGYMTIKDKIGAGSFCKVKEATCVVNREVENPDTGEVEKVKGEQQMAVKVFNRQKLKS